MIGEVDVHGVFVPPLVLWFLIALPLTTLFRRGLVAMGFYNLVWHRALFDAGLFVILLGAVALFFTTFGFEPPSFLGWLS